jgi:hypothetical protein
MGVAVAQSKEDKAKYMRDYYAKNRESCRKKINARRLKDKKHFAFYERLRRYKMTEEDFQLKLVAQDDKCGCCGEFFSPEPSGVQVDHDHACCDRRDGCCGECLRSLLCPRCNRGLGAFGDNVSLLAKAIQYLERWRRV